MIFMASNRKQRGIALITVLMILAIMVTVATAMTGRLTLSLKRTEGIIFSQKVYWYGQAASELARMVLNQDFSDSDVTSLDQIWATPDMVFPLENGQISGSIIDQRSCFNVNAVDSNLAVSQFHTLLASLGISNYKAQTIAESLRDWIDENGTSEGSQGAEDSFYQALSVPYLAANNLITDISELRAIQGVDKATYSKIKPYLCAPPSSDQSVNVNTVSVDKPEILYAIFDDGDEIAISDFKDLLDSRPTSGWSSVNSFLSNSVLSNVTVSTSVKKQLSVSSEYFQFDGIAEFNDRRLAVKFLYEIESSKAKEIRYQSGGAK